MANYAVDLHRTASAATTVGNVNAGPTRPRRTKWYDVIVGSEGTVGDNPFRYDFQRCTTTGTSTSVTPQPLDAADAATEEVAGKNHTIEPSYTSSAILLSIALNQRATFRWVAAPGSELVAPATASNGIGIITSTASAVAVSATVLFADQ